MPVFYEMAKTSKKIIENDSDIMSSGLMTDCLDMFELQMARERSAYAKTIKELDAGFPNNYKKLDDAFNALCSMTHINMEALVEASKRKAKNIGVPVPIVKLNELPTHSGNSIDKQVGDFRKVAMINYLAYELWKRKVSKLGKWQHKLQNYLKEVKTAVNLMTDIAITIHASEIRHVGKLWDVNRKDFHFESKIDHENNPKES